MKKFTLYLLLLSSLSVFCQNRYITRTAHIDFFSSTPLEDISATNNLVSSMLDESNGNFVFQVMMKSFEFKNALMQEHFNEKYIESDEFPTSTFNGKIENFESLEINKLNNNKVVISGILTIHGVPQQISTEGHLTHQDGKINGTASFKVKPEDFNISIPSIVKDKIAKEIIISVAIELNRM